MRTPRTTRGVLFTDMPQTELFPCAPADLLALERQAMSRGYTRIAGIDEAGRGPLAGPVTAAAVILAPGSRMAGVDDSKKLSPALRERLFDTITAEALSIGVATVPAELIDRINILQATRLAMKQALESLSPPPDFILIDGITTIDSRIPQKTVKKGDSLSLSIAAASIIAKVTRDRMMLEYDRLYPGYGFAGHKGYGSASHMAAIRALGPCPIHRLTFGGVREHVR